MTRADGDADRDAQPRWRWEVALSFAGAQRDYVEQVAQALQAREVNCFYDADEQIGLWGKYLAEELPAIYGEQAAAVVVFVSAEYAARDWTRLERRAALARTVRERREYVLPARFDDTPLPGLLSDMVTVDLRTRTPQEFAAMIADKLVALDIVASRPADAGGSAQTAESARPAGAVRVAEADLRRLGVHAAISVPGVPDEVPPEYVPRDIDAAEFGIRAKVTAAARRGGFVLLVGGSSVGKTRCAVEAVRALLPDWWLVHPAGPGEVAALARAPAPRMVVWLDELQRYLDGEDGLTGAMVRALLNAPHPAVIIGTLWPDRYAAYTTMLEPGVGDPHAREREVLDLAAVVRIDAAFSPAEQGRARAAAVRDRRLQIALEAVGYGLTQTLAAAPQLVARWQDATTASPYGWAVLTAALDAARLGARASLSIEFLRAAAPGYCTSRQQAEAPDDWFEQAMAYATGKLHGAVAALSPAGAGMGRVAGYTVADYLIQHGRQSRREELPPATFWNAVIAYADLADLPAYADSAEGRGLYQTAAQLCKQAATAGDAHAAAGLVRIVDGCHQPSGLRAARWAADHVEDHDVAAIGRLLLRLGKMGASDQVAVLAAAAVVRVSLNQPYDVAGLLRNLRDGGAADQVAALARRIVDHAVPKDPVAVVTLLQGLRNAGAEDDATVLADRISLADPVTVSVLLERLTGLDAHTQAARLAIRAVGHIRLDDPGTINRLLDVLQQAGAKDQVAALLARDPASHVILEDPAAVGDLLLRLWRAGSDKQVKVLAGRAASHISLTSPEPLARLLDLLRSAGAHNEAATLLNRDVAEQVALDQAASVGHLLGQLQKAGAGEQAAILASRAACGVPVDDPDAVTSLLIQLRKTCHEEQIPVLASRAARGVPVDDPVAICRLLGELRQAGADDQVATLDSRVAHVPVEDPEPVSQFLASWVVAEVADHKWDPAKIPAEIRALGQRVVHDASLKEPHALVRLWRVLLVAGLPQQAAELAARMGRNASVIDPAAMRLLLEELHKFGVHDQLAELAAQVADDESLSDPAAAVQLLPGLRELGFHERLDRLATRAANFAPLEKPGTVALLLKTLAAVGARDQAAALLARNPASSISLSNPGGVAYLIDTLIAVGACGQVASLLARKPASHVTIDGRYGVNHLLMALRKAGDAEQAATLVTRAANVGMLFGELVDDPATAEWRPFGRKPDGHPAAPWGWEDLN